MSWRVPVAGSSGLIGSRAVAYDDARGGPGEGPLDGALNEPVKAGTRYRPVVHP